MSNTISSNVLVGLGDVWFREELQTQGNPRDLLTLDEVVVYLEYTGPLLIGIKI